ncbi:glycosyltransferase [Oceanobacillus picturae]|uniref:Glycosyltransferase n=1 Tax=Oceanobacillus picturae TaxID=171693 RepID=A0A0U9H462_9BACI|nr:flagellar brake domain-containing protein [Oceanobacillus picturae]GAQ17466.1 glycosyltransferase [Oceanobacillus picturae]
MKIGSVLTLELKKTGKKMETYRCKIIEKSEHYLFIDYPINEKTKKTTFIPKGTVLKAMFMDERQNLYAFKTEIVAKVKLAVPGIAIKLPGDDLKRIQRREFVRVEAAIDVAIHSKNNSFSPIVTVSTDISGGGLSVILPHGKTMEGDGPLDLWLTLDMQSGEYFYINAEAELVFIKEQDTHVHTASLKFINLLKEDQHKIIRFSFEKQREARKKELSI